jgi:hypothetical protein
LGALKRKVTVLSGFTCGDLPKPPGCPKAIPAKQIKTPAAAERRIDFLFILIVICGL